EKIGETVGVEPWNHDMTALHQPDRVAYAYRRGLAREQAHPRPRGIHRRSRGERLPSRWRRERGSPQVTLDFQLLTAGASQDDSAAVAGIDCVQHDEARVIGPAVGVHESMDVSRLERRARHVMPQVDPSGACEAASAGKMVVEKEPGANHPGRPQMCVVGQDEAQRAHEVWRGAEQDLTLDERLAHERQLQVLEVAEAAMDELGTGGGGVSGEVILLAQQDRKTAAGGVPRDAGAVDAATDDQQI